LSERISSRHRAQVQRSYAEIKFPTSRFVCNLTVKQVHYVFRHVYPLLVIVLRKMRSFVRPASVARSFIPQAKRDRLSRERSETGRDRSPRTDGIVHPASEARPFAPHRLGRSPRERSETWSFIQHGGTVRPAKTGSFIPRAKLDGTGPFVPRAKRDGILLFYKDFSEEFYSDISIRISCGTAFTQNFLCKTLHERISRRLPSGRSPVSFMLGYTAKSFLSILKPSFLSWRNSRIVHNPFGPFAGHSCLIFCSDCPTKHPSTINWHFVLGFMKGTELYSFLKLTFSFLVSNLYIIRFDPRWVLNFFPR
jgi:hypothetical protein